MTGSQLEEAVERETAARQRAEAAAEAAEQHLAAADDALMSPFKRWGG